MTNTLPVAAVNLPNKLDDKEVIDLIKNTVAKGATDAELMLFLHRAKATNLDPLKNEIWFIKTGNGVQMPVGINGFYTTANRHPAYDGISEPEFGKDDGGVFCRVEVYRKDRSHPQVAKLYQAEFAKNYGNWKTMPRYMLSKCTEAVALRKAFPQELNDCYIPEELGEVAQPQPVEAKPALPHTKPADELPKEYYFDLRNVSEEKLAEAKELISTLGGNVYEGAFWTAPRTHRRLKRLECSRMAADMALNNAGDKLERETVETPLGEQIDMGGEGYDQ